jgi:hypothetical protein
MVLTLPPLENSETISRSPSAWSPVNAVVSPSDSQATSSCRNQKPTLPVPVLALRSSPK